jgi:hypothetical protein
MTELTDKIFIRMEKTALKEGERLLRIDHLP